MKKKKHTIDIGVIPKRWKYSKEPRIEGLFKMLNSAKINYVNITEEEYKQIELLNKIEKKKQELNRKENKYGTR